MHSHHIVNRDIKEENIKEENIKVIAMPELNKRQLETYLKIYDNEWTSK